MDILREVCFLLCGVGLVLGAALFLSMVLHRSSASVRRQILVQAFAVAAILPLLLGILPRPAKPFVESEYTQTSLNLHPTEAMRPTLEVCSPTIIQEGGADQGAGWILIFPLGLWILVAAVLLARLGLSHLRVRRLVQGGRIMEMPHMAKTVPVLISPEVVSPLVTGLLRSVILVPETAEQWDAPTREAIMRHELAHVHNRDNLVNLMAWLVVSLNWINPLAWLALGKLRHESELTCDDAVITAGIKASSFATILLDQTKGVAMGMEPMAVASFASGVSGRLHTMLDPRSSRIPARRRVSVLSLVFSISLVLMLTPLRPAALSWASEKSGELQMQNQEVIVPLLSEGKNTFWTELTGEFKESRALNIWHKNPSLGTPLANGRLTDVAGGWTVESNDAVILPGSKYGVVFTSTDGFVRLTRNYEGQKWQYEVNSVADNTISDTQQKISRWLERAGLGVAGQFPTYMLTKSRDHIPQSFNTVDRSVIQSVLATLMD